LDKPQTAGFTYADGFLAEPVDEHVSAPTFMEQDEEEQESDDDAKSPKRGRVEDNEAQAEGNTFFEPFSPLIR